MAATRDPLDSLPPWEATPYFESPRENKVSVSAGATAQVVPGNPNRVGLIMVGTGISTATVSLLANTDGTSGFNLSSTLVPIMLLYSEVGPLCQQAWYCKAAGNITMTYYEITLARWPRVSGTNGRTRRAPTA